MKARSLARWLLCALCAAVIGVAGCSGGGSHRASTGEGGIGDERRQIREAETALTSANEALEEVRDAESPTTQELHDAVVAVRDAATTLVELLITQGTSAERIAELEMELVDIIAEAETLTAQIERQPITDAWTMAIGDAEANAMGEVDVADVMFNEVDGVSMTLGEGDGSTWSDGREVPAIPSWDGREFTRSSNDGTENETVIVYTDIGRAPMKPFSVVHHQGTDVDGIYTYRIMAGEIGLIDAEDAMEGQVQSAGDPPTMEGNGEWTAAGTFNAVEGEFTCEMGCGQRGPRVGWTFTPHDPSSLVNEPDGRTDWLAYGVWISESTTENGTLVSNLELFGDGKEPYTGSTTALTGTARYEGAATGVYVMGAEAAQAREGEPEGWFTASTRLTATFGAQDSTGDIGSIRGHIDRFTDEAGNEIVGWRLNLDEATLEQAGTDDAPTTWTGDTQGNAEGTGTWSGQFYGVPVANDENLSDDHPVGAAGEFTGIFNNGAAAGAYGARIPGS